ncbi:MAG TPA: NADH-quinone oxidoreductase subunit M, partial [Actinomycetales bacterium]|nr:NADH-quinone oxidoreductase subunit M [Actinomycetales bacterium]
MLLTVVVLLPALVAAVLAAVPRMTPRVVSVVWIAATVVDLLMIAWMWWRYDPSTQQGSLGAGMAYDVKVSWIPSVDASYHVGVDGISLPLLAVTAVLFGSCAIWSARQPDRPRTYAALFLFLQTACLGTFAALDLILFFVFFDLSIVGMYFVIAGWGHGNNRRSALKFFLYTFVGSLALLVGFIALYLGSESRTFDMVALAADPPLADSPVAGGLALLAIGVGLAVKTPTFPFHTWLPDAHTDAPAAGSAILAGVLLKLGTYGFIRIAMPMLPDAWQRWAVVIIVVGVVSVVWGALVALAQTDVKRMIAYTSVNHMGYVLL